jgi:hypothetical protein
MRSTEKFDYLGVEHEKLCEIEAMSSSTRERFKVWIAEPVEEVDEEHPPKIFWLEVLDDDTEGGLKMMKFTDLDIPIRILFEKMRVDLLKQIHQRESSEMIQGLLKELGIDVASLTEIPARNEDENLEPSESLEFWKTRDWHLADKATGKPVAFGELIMDSDGDLWELVGARPPHKPESTGRIWARTKDGDEREFFPSVLNLQWHPGPKARYAE